MPPPLVLERAALLTAAPDLHQRLQRCAKKFTTVDPHHKGSIQLIRLHLATVQYTFKYGRLLKPTALGRAVLEHMTYVEKSKRSLACHR